jgi:hypothetical protein
VGQTRWLDEANPPLKQKLRGGLPGETRIIEFEWSAKIEFMKGVGPHVIFAAVYVLNWQAAQR